MNEPRRLSDAALERSGLGADELGRLAAVARQAAAAGAEQLRRHFGQLERVREKGRAGDLVTEADLAAEQAVLAVLSAETPATARASRTPLAVARCPQSQAPAAMPAKANVW